MSFEKVEYKDQETIITAKNMNDIQDAILTLEDGLFTMESNRSGEIITITDASNRGFRSLNIFGKTTQDGTPTPDAPVDLVSVGDNGNVYTRVTGKNILRYPYRDGPIKTINGITFSAKGDGTVTVSGTATTNATFFFTNYNFALKKGVTYTISIGDGLVASGAYLWIATDTGNTITGINLDNARVSAFTPKNDVYNAAVYIYIEAGGSVNGTLYPQLEVGANATTYEPYKVQEVSISTPDGLPGVPVTSGGNYTDANGQQWICDEIDLARGVYVQRVRKLNAYNETVYDAGISASGVSHNFYIHGDVYDTGPNYKARTIPAICNKFIATGMDIGSFGIGTVDNSGWIGIARIVFRAPLDVNTVALFKEYIGEDCQVFYRLKDEITTPLSEEELAAYASLHTYRGTTTVSNDAGAWMDLEYVMDAKKYIDRVMAGTIIPATVE